MTHISRFLLVILIVATVTFVWRQWQEPVPELVKEDVSDQEPEESIQTTYSSLKGVEIILTYPIMNSTITSPLTVIGEAPGYWFFEASFPLMLVNWDGLIIAEGYATAQEEWMTEDYVPFEATLEFEVPQGDEDFFRRGALILQRDNPSGLPENDDAIEIPVRFEP